MPEDAALPVARPEFPPPPESLALWRRALGLTQGQVAVQCKLSVAWISFIEGEFGWDKPNAEHFYERHVGAVERAYRASATDAAEAARALAAARASR